jgi:hypothetical protein
VVPLLYHLDPTAWMPARRGDRFAPLQADPARFGIEPGGPASPYGIIFSPGFLSRTGFDLGAYAYYFQRTFDASRQLRPTCSQLDCASTTLEGIARTAARRTDSGKHPAPQKALRKRLVLGCKTVRHHSTASSPGDPSSPNSGATSVWSSPATRHIRPSTASGWRSELRAAAADWYVYEGSH